jgi:hypothetical protein
MNFVGRTGDQELSVLAKIKSILACLTFFLLHDTFLPFEGKEWGLGDLKNEGLISFSLFVRLLYTEYYVPWYVHM